MNELEVRLIETLVKLMVQYPDGLIRIWTALMDVIEIGEELAQELPQMSASQKGKDLIH